MAIQAKPISVTLGGMTERAAARVRSGRYTSMSEVLREGLRALDRQDDMFDALLKAKVAEALADPRPSIPMSDAVKELKRRAADHRAAHES